MRSILLVVIVSILIVGGEETSVSSRGELSPRQTYVLPALYGGLTNQKFSLYASVAYCMLNNATLVLPEWVLDYQSPQFITKPFDYLYTIDHDRLVSLPSISHFAYVPSLPVHLLSPCMAQLQASAYDTLYPPVSIIEDYSRSHGVVCLNAEGTFYGLANIVQNQLAQSHFHDFIHHNSLKAFRSVLVLNYMYTKIVSTIQARMMSMMGSADFISVHARVESDFIDACKIWPRRSGKPDDNTVRRACYENDSAIYYVLTNLVTFPVNNSVLMIMNYNKGDTEFKELPTLCNRQCVNSSTDCYVFHCVRKEFFLEDGDLFSMFPGLVRSVSSIAMIDALLATHGILFLGNMYSTMSVDIVEERSLGRTPYTESVFYNRPCSHHSTNYSECP